MKRIMWFAGIMIVLIGVLSACQSSAETVTETAANTDTTSASGDASAAGGGPGGALNAITTASLQFLYLQTSDSPLTADQASIMLPLWTELKTLQESGSIDDPRVNEVLIELEGNLTADQINALSGVTQDDLLAWAQNEELIGGFGGPGFGGPNGTPPTDLSDEDRATRQAQFEGGTPPVDDGSRATIQAEMAAGTPPAGMSEEDFATMQAQIAQGTPPAAGEFPGGGRGGFGGGLVDDVIAMLEGLLE